jgi:hypothetical protein
MNFFLMTSGKEIIILLSLSYRTILGFTPVIVV